MNRFVITFGALARRRRIPTIVFQVLMSGMLTTGSAQAAVLWSQMNYLSIDYGAQSTIAYANSKAFDDFKFNADATIESLSWAGMVWLPTTVPRHMNTPFGVEIWSSVDYPDAVNPSWKKPDSLLASYTFTFPPASAEATQVVIDPSWPIYNESTPLYRYDATLAVPFLAQADTHYFISIFNANTNQPAAAWEKEFYWKLVNGVTLQKPNYGAYPAVGNDVAFELRGNFGARSVPEPSTLLMIVCGFMGLAALKRTKGD